MTPMFFINIDETWIRVDQIAAIRPGATNYRCAVHLVGGDRLDIFKSNLEGHVNAQAYVLDRINKAHPQRWMTGMTPPRL